MFMKEQVSSIWKKKIDMTGSRIRTYSPEDPLYHTNHYTTLDLVDGEEIIQVHIASTPT